MCRLCEPENRKLTLTAAEMWALGCAVVGAIFALVAFLTYLPNQEKDALSTVGTFLSGTTGILWATAGILIVYATFRSQQSQNLLQREEIARTNQRLDQDSLRETEERFETTFFRMLTLHHEIVNALFLRSGDDAVGTPYERTNQREFQGRRCFQAIYHAFKTNNYGVTGNLADVATVEARYEKFFDAYESSLAHYFRNLYHIVKFIRSNAPKSGSLNEVFYLKFLRAQLSTYEQVLLFYNSFSEGGAAFKQPAIETHLLHHVKKSLLLDPSHWETDRFYPASAFEDFPD